MVHKRVMLIPYNQSARALASAEVAKGIKSVLLLRLFSDFLTALALRSLIRQRCRDKQDKEKCISEILLALINDSKLTPSLFVIKDELASPTRKDHLKQSLTLFYFHKIFLMQIDWKCSHLSDFLCADGKQQNTKTLKLPDYQQNYKIKPVEKVECQYHVQRA
ncbi:hypothetical protein GQR58_010517 [Nymphon striatum]|nr:hypothetical protein GQR58_010517 [Nymphon striatum]